MMRIKFQYRVNMKLGRFLLGMYVGGKKIGNIRPLAELSLSSSCHARGKVRNIISHYFHNSKFYYCGASVTSLQSKYG
jgi:hypothetical protein